MKKVFKYATGQEIPEGAIYLNTLRQESIYDEISKAWCRCWLVWHYFLVEVKDE